MNLVVATVIGALFSLLVPTPASAILGLGQCEKVKKQIMGLESIANNEIQYWNMRIDRPVSEKMSIRLNNFENKNLAKQIWKLAYNNRKCFSASQSLEIDRRTKYEGVSNQWRLINLRWSTQGYGNECLGREMRKPIDLGIYASGKGKGAPFCNVPPKVFVLKSEYLQSIYSY
jgi:hypothetical protein